MTCRGQTKKDTQCKRKALDNGFCHMHQSQKPEPKYCKCFLPDGTICREEFEGDGSFCHTHQHPNKCRGMTITRNRCDNDVWLVHFCPAHILQSAELTPKIAESARKARSKLKDILPMPAPTERSRAFSSKVSVTVPESLSVVRLEKPEDCLICLESLDKVSRSLRCGHWFHNECIAGMCSFQCPMCRQEMTPISKKVREQIQENIKKKHDEEIAQQEEYARRLVAQEMVLLVVTAFM